MFRARLPSIFITSHKMPRLPRNLHLVATLHNPDNAIRKTRNTTRLKCCASRKMTRDTSEVPRLPRKLQLILRKRRKSMAPTTQNDFRHVTKHVWMSRSATPATRNEATRRLKPPKMTPWTYHRHGHTAITRTVANGCGRLGNVERTHPQPPDPQSETGTLATHSGKKGSHWSRFWINTSFSVFSVFSVLSSLLFSSLLSGDSSSPPCMIRT